MYHLQKYFTVEEFKDKSLHVFRNEIKELIAIKNMKNTLMLSSDLKASGITFYVVTLDENFALQMQERFDMQFIQKIEDVANMGIEYGNRAILQFLEE